MSRRPSLAQADQLYHSTQQPTRHTRRPSHDYSYHPPQPSSRPPPSQSRSMRQPSSSQQQQRPRQRSVSTRETEGSYPRQPQVTPQSHSLRPRAPSSQSHDPHTPLRSSQPQIPTYRASSNPRRPTLAIHTRQSSTSEPPRRAVHVERPQASTVSGWTALRANSMDSISSNEGGEGRRGSSAGDSGYEEGPDSSKGYLDSQWKTIRRAVWGEQEDRGREEVEPITASTNGSLLWDRLLAATSVATSVVATRFAGVGVPVAFGGADDDARLDEQGDTKLTRVLKEYHISQATSSSDLPPWLFSRSEINDRRSPSPPPAPQPSRRREPQRVDTFSYQRQEYDRGSRRREGEREVTQSRTTDKLRAMREAKRTRG